MAYSGIEPWGDDRADLRASVNTAAAVGAWGAKGIEAGDFASYLQIHSDDEIAEASPDRVAALMNGVL